MNVNRRNFFKVLAGSVVALSLRPWLAFGAPTTPLASTDDIAASSVLRFGEDAYVFHVTGSKTISSIQSIPGHAVVVTFTDGTSVQFLHGTTITIHAPVAHAYYEGLAQVAKKKKKKIPGY